MLGRRYVINYLRLDEWIPITGIRQHGCRDIRYPWVFPWVDGWSTDPRVLGCHSLVSELRYTITLGLMGRGLDHCIRYAFHVLCPNMLHDCVLCCVNYIHGKIIGKKKRNTKIRKHNLGGSKKERMG